MVTAAYRLGVFGVMTLGDEHVLPANLALHGYFLAIFDNNLCLQMPSRVCVLFARKFTVSEAIETRFIAFFFCIKIHEYTAY